MDHMVTGGSPATMTGAEQLGLRREDDPEGEGEGGRHGEHRELTLGKLVRVARSEEAGRRRVIHGGSVGRGEEADGGGDAGDPAAIPCTGRCSLARRRRRLLRLAPRRLQSPAMRRGAAAAMAAESKG